jgi:predicted phage-related endonuclease
MKSLKTLLALLFICSLTTFAFSQNEKHKVDKEKIKAMKVAFITQKIDLTTDEAQKFWPVYNEFEKKNEELFLERKKIRKVSKSDIELTDKQIETNINNEFNLKQKELDLEKEYFIKFKTVISIKKIEQLYLAQDQFKRELLRKIKKGGANDANIPPPPPH